MDEDSERRLSIMSSIAQDELCKLSFRVKFGHQQAIKDRMVLGNSRIFGYTKDGGRLVINEEEAPMVRKLFELYATGQYSMKQIETIFWEKGYRNHISPVSPPSYMVSMVEFEHSYESTGPFGTKSIGEIAINTPGPAILHAIYRATGKWFRELPITPEQIAMTMS